jgi:CMP/dCMP kinase
MAREPRAVVTIDGPAGAGKTTVARALAERLGFSLLDSGALYRAVALCALEQAVDLGDDPALERIAAGLQIRFEPGSTVRCLLGERDVTEAIRAPAVSEAASRVSARPRVRAALLVLQRRLGAQGLVAEGRDMGTVVFPDAAVKFFLVASPGERARRRAQELRLAGHEGVREAEVEREQEIRDRRDSERQVAPLRPAPDAQVVDTTGKTLAEVIDRLHGAVLDALPRNAGSVT